MLLILNTTTTILTRIKALISKTFIKASTIVSKVIQNLPKLSPYLKATVGLALTIFVVMSLVLNIITAAQITSIRKSAAEQKELITVMDEMLNERITETEHHLETIINDRLDALEQELLGSTIDPPEEDEDHTITDVYTSHGYTDSTRPIMTLSSKDLYKLESIVAGEAGNQPYLGMMAVAQCVMNAMLKDGYSVSQVQSIYKYSGYYDINSYESRYPSNAQMVKEAVADVFFHQKVVTDANILWFCNPAKVSSNVFHYSQNRIIDIVDHAFFAPW